MPERIDIAAGSYFTLAGVPCVCVEARAGRAIIYCANEVWETREDLKLAASDYRRGKDAQKRRDLKRHRARLDQQDAENS